MFGFSLKRFLCGAVSRRCCQFAKDPNGETLSTLAAILLAVLATYSAEFQPIDTVPNGTSIVIDASPYSGAINGSYFKAFDAYGTAVPAFLTKPPMNGTTVIPNAKDFVLID